ncbi:hypothetical protein [Streptomyces sp. NPDC002994]|uniref:hypothetical protein n=1 Tax=Streptomyces sp. NPDC002994 TaxID=3154441 RepID=UPI0033B514B6
MKTLASRRLAPAVTAAALLAALATGCAGSDPASPAKDAKDSNPTAEQPADQPAGAVLTAAQLKAALVTPADAKGFEGVDNTPTPVRPKSDKPECSPLADATASGTARTPEAKAWSSRNYSSGATPGLSTTTSLFSYEGEGAQQTLDSLRKAVTDCAGGFSTSGNNGGATVKYVSVKPGESAKAADDSVSWVMTGEAGGTQVPMHLTAVREDNTVALFFTIHLTDPSKSKLPQDLFTSQTAKLTEHAGKGAS